MNASSRTPRVYPWMNEPIVCRICKQLYTNHITTFCDLFRLKSRNSKNPGFSRGNLLVIGSYGHFWRAYTNGDSSFDIDLPTWPAKLVVPVMLTILALRLLLHIWGYARALKQGGDSPVAVPLIEDAATQAAREAASLEANSQRSSEG